MYKRKKKQVVAWRQRLKNQSRTARQDSNLRPLIFQYSFCLFVKKLVSHLFHGYITPYTSIVAFEKKKEEAFSQASPIQYKYNEDTEPLYKTKQELYRIKKFVLTCHFGSLLWRTPDALCANMAIFDSH